jgi:hypothetical protein
MSPRLTYTSGALGTETDVPQFMRAQSRTTVG